MDSSYFGPSTWNIIQSMCMRPQDKSKVPIVPQVMTPALWKVMAKNGDK